MSLRHTQKHTHTHTHKAKERTTAFAIDLLHHDSYGGVNIMYVQVVRAVSSLPHGSDVESAAAAVRALGPPFKGVTAVDSGLVDVLTQQERSAKDTDGELGQGKVDTAAARDREEESNYEGLLLGMEVRCDSGGDRESTRRCSSSEEVCCISGGGGRCSGGHSCPLY